MLFLNNPFNWLPFTCSFPRCSFIATNIYVSSVSFSPAPRVLFPIPQQQPLYPVASFERQTKFPWSCVTLEIRCLFCWFLKMQICCIVSMSHNYLFSKLQIHLDKQRVTLLIFMIPLICRVGWFARFSLIWFAHLDCVFFQSARSSNFTKQTDSMCVQF